MKTNMNSILIICEDSPFGKNSVIESIRLASGILAVGDIEDCKVVLLKDAIYFLNRQIDPLALNLDSLNDLKKLMDLSNLEIYICEEDLTILGLTEGDLMTSDSIQLISHDLISKLILEADFTFKY